MLFRAISLLLLITLDESFSGENTVHWSEPTHVAMAGCSRFSKGPGLEATTDTLNLLEKAAEKLAQTNHPVSRWENGTSIDFQKWMDGLAIHTNEHTRLVFYFTSHQKKNGDLRFSEGPDLPPETYVENLNRLSTHFPKVVLIQDCCHATSLEGKAHWNPQITRIYTSGLKEEAIDYEFRRAPFGVDGFIRNELQILDQNLHIKPQALTYFTLLNLKTACSWLQNPTPTLHLKSYLNHLQKQQEIFKDVVRHHGVQQFHIYPPTEDVPLVKISVTR